VFLCFFNLNNVFYWIFIVFLLVFTGFSLCFHRIFIVLQTTYSTGSHSGRRAVDSACMIGLCHRPLCESGRFRIQRSCRDLQGVPYCTHIDPSVVYVLQNSSRCSWEQVRRCRMLSSWKRVLGCRVFLFPAYIRRQLSRPSGKDSSRRSDAYTGTLLLGRTS